MENQSGHNDWTPTTGAPYTDIQDVLCAEVSGKGVSKESA